MNLLLPCNMSLRTAGVLDFLVPVERLPDGLGLRTESMPHLHREYHRIAPRVVIENGLDGRIGVDHPNMVRPRSGSPERRGATRRKQARARVSRACRGCRSNPSVLCARSPSQSLIAF